MRKYVAEFIKYQYKRSDMSMNELTEEFIRDYCLYLKNVVGLAQSSIWIYSIPLKHIVTAAHYNGKIQRNPFAMYHVDPDHKERGLDYMKSGMEVRTVTDYGVFIPASGTQTFVSHTGQQISIINFGAKGLKGEGLVYPLSDFTNWWQGTLNEATSNRFTIQCTGEYLVFLASM